MTQEEAVLQWFKFHHSILPKQAWEELGIYRLSAIIYRLKKRGHQIETVLVKVPGKYGETPVALYIYKGKKEEEPA